MIFSISSLLSLLLLHLTFVLSHVDQAQCKYGQTIAVRTEDGAVITLGSALCDEVNGYVMFTETKDALQALETIHNKQCLGVLSNGNFVCHTLYPSPAKQKAVAHTGIIAAWVGSELHFMPQVGSQNKVNTDRASQEGLESSKQGITFNWRATQESPVVQYSSALPKQAETKEQPFYVKYWYLFLPVILILVGQLGQLGK